MITSVKMHHNTLHFQQKYCLFLNQQIQQKGETRFLNETYGGYCINLTITSARFERRAEQRRQAYRLLPGLTT
jgi:hypothetical protein